MFVITMLQRVGDHCVNESCATEEVGGDSSYALGVIALTMSLMFFPCLWCTMPDH